jgi:hypothetical protein
MRKFELALHPDKTRLIRFGRHAACKCATAVEDDEELERVGDLALVSENAFPLGPGHVIKVGWMPGRSRAYGVKNRAAGPALSIGFNDR